MSAGEFIQVKNIEKGEILSFLSIRNAFAEFMGIHTSCLAKTIKESKFYSNSKILIYKSSTPLEDIFNNEAYKKKKRF